MFTQCVQDEAARADLRCAKAWHVLEATGGKNSYPRNKQPKRDSGRIEEFDYADHFDVSQRNKKRWTLPYWAGFDIL